MQSPSDVGNTFSRAWQLLTANWIIIVPGIVVGIIAAVAIGVLTMSGLIVSAGAVALAGSGAGVGAVMLSGLAIAVIGALAFVITTAYTTGMADAAWRTGTATLADGSASLKTRGSDVLVAGLLLLLVCFVAFALAIPTLFLSMLAFTLFFIYTFAAVIVGHASGPQALGESCRIALANFGSTALVVILLVVAAVVGGAIGGMFRNVALLGPLVQYVIQYAILAYATLVIVGEYIKVRGSSPAMVGTPPSAPTV